MTETGPFADARVLLRGCRHASLATLDETGAPFATLVAVAPDARGAPLLFISGLARHTANLERDGRASLLLDGSEGRTERLAAPRLTLAGRAAPLAGGTDEARRRWLARHPDAAGLFELGDFRFWRLEPAAGHLVAGFGRISTVAGEELLVPAILADELAAMEPGAIEHMHEDHGDAVDALAGAAGSRLAALDADGLDLVAGGQPVRRNFRTRLGASGDLRGAIVELVRSERKS